MHDIKAWDAPQKLLGKDAHMRPIQLDVLGRRRLVFVVVVTGMSLESGKKRRKKKKTRRVSTAVGSAGRPQDAAGAHQAPGMFS